MAAKTFQSGRGKKKPIPFAIDEDEYVFTPPKVATIATDLFDDLDSDDETRATSSARAAFDWLSNGLPEKQAERIKTRLKDPDDDLDLPDIVEVIKWLLGKVSGRPTTSRRG